jgi:hypothetical protein
LVLCAVGSWPYSQTFDQTGELWQEKHSSLLGPQNDPSKFATLSSVWKVFSKRNTLAYSASLSAMKKKKGFTKLKLGDATAFAAAAAGGT